MVEHLPADCASARASKGEGFTRADHLLLTVVDLLSIANWQRGNAGLPKSKQSKPPTPLPRPGTVVRKPVTLKQLLEQRKRTRR